MTPRKRIVGVLVVPPPTPARARRAAAGAMFCLALADLTLATVVVFGMGALGAPPWAVLLMGALLGPVVAVAMAAQYHHTRLGVRHARRWHTEPLYRARWENDQ